MPASLADRQTTTRGYPRLRSRFLPKFSNAGNQLGTVDSLGWRDDLGDHKRVHGKLLGDVQCAR